MFDIEKVQKELNKLEISLNKQRQVFEELRASIYQKCQSEIDINNGKKVSYSYDNIIKLTKMYVNDLTECPNCEGEGQYYDMAGDDNAEEPLLFPCNDCEGEGTISAKDLSAISYNRNDYYKEYLKYLLQHLWNKYGKPTSAKGFFAKEKFDNLIEKQQQQ